MKIPERYRNLHLALQPAPLVPTAPDGAPLAWPEVAFYPPPGFLPIPGLFELGNGDVHGFYWPIGREAEPPLLCEFYHDGGELEPHASSLEALVKLKALTGFFGPDDPKYEDALSLAEQLGFALPEATESPPPALRLAIDCRSSSALHAAASVANRAGRLDDAERHLLAALEVLPEYTAALHALAALHRRQGRLGEAAARMVEALGAPLCFGRGREECLRRLQRLPDSDYAELAADPLWANRHRLSFQTGVKQNGDFAIYEEAIAEYLRQRQEGRAIRLRVLVGELMGRETVSFRERYGYTLERHRELLEANLREAGLEVRLIA